MWSWLHVGAQRPSWAPGTQGYLLQLGGVAKAFITEGSVAGRFYVVMERKREDLPFGVTASGAPTWAPGFARVLELLKDNPGWGSDRLHGMSNAMRGKVLEELVKTGRVGLLEMPRPGMTDDMTSSIFYGGKTLVRQTDLPGYVMAYSRGRDPKRRVVPEDLPGCGLLPSHYILVEAYEWKRDEGLGSSTAEQGLEIFLGEQSAPYYAVARLPGTKPLVFEAPTLEAVRAKALHHLRGHEPTSDAPLPTWNLQSVSPAKYAKDFGLTLLNQNSLVEACVWSARFPEGEKQRRGYEIFAQPGGAFTFTARKKPSVTEPQHVFQGLTSSREETTHHAKACAEGYFGDGVPFSDIKLITQWASKGFSYLGKVGPYDLSGRYTLVPQVIDKYTQVWEKNAVWPSDLIAAFEWAGPDRHRAIEIFDGTKGPVVVAYLPQVGKAENWLCLQSHKPLGDLLAQAETHLLKAGVKVGNEAYGESLANSKERAQMREFVWANQYRLRERNLKNYPRAFDSQGNTIVQAFIWEHGLVEECTQAAEIAWDGRRVDAKYRASIFHPNKKEEVLAAYAESIGAAERWVSEQLAGHPQITRLGIDIAKLKQKGLTEVYTTGRSLESYQTFEWGLSGLEAIELSFHRGNPEPYRATVWDEEGAYIDMLSGVDQAELCKKLETYILKGQKNMSDQSSSALIFQGAEMGAVSAAVEQVAVKLLEKTGGDPTNPVAVHMAKIAIVLGLKHIAFPAMGDKIPKKEFLERRVDVAITGVSATASFEATQTLFELVTPLISVLTEDVPDILKMLQPPAPEIIAEGAKTKAKARA